MTTKTLEPQSITATDSAVDAQSSMALIARLLLAAIFVLSGFFKIGAAEGTIGYIASVGLPFADAIYYAVVALEIIGGLALVVGFKTRLIASALAAFSIAAAVIFHADFADQNQFIHFLKNVALAGGLLQVAAFGPGRYSIDRK